MHIYVTHYFTTAFLFLLNDFFTNKMQIKSHHSKKVDENSLKIQNAFPSSRLLPIIPYFTFIHHDHITDWSDIIHALSPHFAYILNHHQTPSIFHNTCTHIFYWFIHKAIYISIPSQFFFLKNSNKHFIVILTHPYSYIFSIPPKKNTFPPSPPPSSKTYILTIHSKGHSTSTSQ